MKKKVIGIIVAIVVIALAVLGVFYGIKVSNEKKAKELTVELNQTEYEVEAGSTLSTDDMDMNITSGSEYQVSFVEEPNYTMVGLIDAKLLINNEAGSQETVAIKINVVDTTAPVIEGMKDITMTTLDTVDFLSGVTASDIVDLDVTKQIVVSDIDTTIAGETDLTYSVKDNAGNEANETIKVTVSNFYDECDKMQFAIEKGVTIFAEYPVDEETSGKLGSLGVNVEVHVIGTTESGWSVIDYESSLGYVKSTLLSDEKVVVKTQTQPQTNYTAPAPQQPQQPAPQPATPSAPASGGFDSGLGGGVDPNSVTWGDMSNVDWGGDGSMADVILQ